MTQEKQIQTQQLALHSLQELRQRLSPCRNESGQGDEARQNPAPEGASYSSGFLGA